MKKKGKKKSKPKLRKVKSVLKFNQLAHEVKTIKPRKLVLPIVVAALVVILASLFLPLEIQETKKGDIVSCSDSEPNISPFIQGSIKLEFESGVSELKKDYCLNEKEVREYSCSGSEVKETSTGCDIGCSEGACLLNKEDNSIIIAEPLTDNCQEYNFVSPKNSFSSSNYKEYSALEAIDIDPNSHWFGLKEDTFPKWISFDLGERKCIKEIDLYTFSRDLPLQFDVHVSNDHIRWSAIHEDVFLTKPNTLGIQFPDTVLARYIRIQQTSSSRDFGSLADIRINVADFPESLR